MCAELAATTDLRKELHRLAEAARVVSLQLDPSRRATAAQHVRDIVWSIDEYALPRLADLEAPLVAVLIGSTGAGKSTLVNSLAQARISTPGAVRPTTRHPIVWAHTRHADRYRQAFLTGYTSDEGAERRIEVVASDDPLVDHLTVIDAPDIDSVEERHRAIADELLAVADVCVFVTSAQRYADAVPWEFLRRARERGLPVVFVLNRAPVDVADAVASDYRRRLQAGRVFEDDDELVVIPEQPIDPRFDGLVADAVAGVVDRLRSMGSSSSTVVGAVRGAVADVIARAERLVTLVEFERDEVAAMRDAIDHAYAAQAEELERALDQGTLIRAEVVKRWQAFIGTGELLKALSDGAGTVSSWFRRVFGGADVATVEREAEHELVATIERRADIAASATATAWEVHPGGKSLVKDATLWRHDPETGRFAEQAVEDWIAGLTALVAEAGEGKRRWARAASLGVNAVAVTLIVTVFVHTSGLSGAEVGVAAGAAAAQQRLLEHLFGSAAARSLAQTARNDLLAALLTVLQRDAARFHAVLDGLDPRDPAELRDAADAVRSELRGWRG